MHPLAIAGIAVAGFFFLSGGSKAKAKQTSPDSETEPGAPEGDGTPGPRRRPLRPMTVKAQRALCQSPMTLSALHQRILIRDVVMPIYEEWADQLVGAGPAKVDQVLNGIAAGVLKGCKQTPAAESMEVAFRLAQGAFWQHQAGTSGGA